MTRSRLVRRSCGGTPREKVALCFGTELFDEKDTVGAKCRGCRIWNHPITATFCSLCTDAKHARGRINIVGTESAKFLLPKRRIVGKREHRTVADRLPTCGCQNRLPVCIVGNPRQPAIAANEDSPAVRYHRVLAAKALIDKVAVEKPEHGYSLLNRRIRDRGPFGLHRGEIRTDVSPCHRRDHQLMGCEKAEENLESSAVSIESVATETSLRLKRKPVAAE